MKKHKVIPLETMQIDFLDRTLLFRFDVEAITKLQDEFGDLETLSVKYKNNNIELGAIMLYSGVKDENFTLDEAKVIVISSPEVLVDTIDITIKSLEIIGGEEVRKKLKEELAKLGIQTMQ